MSSTTSCVTDTAPARIVIVGGGIAGCSAAYHLAALGMTDVVLLERSRLSSGTTWHSTGNMETYRPDPMVFEMVRYAADLYPRLAQQTGQDIGWRRVGRVMYTDRGERWESMRLLPELGRARGIELELLSPAEAQARLPILSTQDLLGAVWIPSDARVNPTDAAMAFASAARARGVRIVQDTPVTRIVLRDGAVQGVETNAGLIPCEKVVIAAGLWSADLARTCGLRLPLHALEHQYLITQPLGIDRNLPLFLSLDDQLYGREEVGGIMVGSLDDEAIPLSTAELPQNFSFSLLSERWPQFEPYMATAMRRFPVLQTAGIKMLLNGPESFTPDGQMLLGPVPGASGVYSACGFNSNGMALAPAAGRFIAEWIVEGEPGVDVAQLDVRRFSPVQSDEEYLRRRVSEIPGYHCRIHAEDDDYRTARNIRLSPLHEQLAMAGARFGSVNGWERALWIGESDHPGPWVRAVSSEVQAGEDAVLIVDRSTDAKHLIPGSLAADALRRQLPALDLIGRNALATVPMAGGHGQIEALARVLRASDDSFMLLTGPEQESRLAEWLRRADLLEAAAVRDVTGTHAVVELIGPRRGALLAALGCKHDGRSCWIGAVPVILSEDSVNDSTLVIAAAEGGVPVWQALLTVGRSFGLRIGGHLAQQAMRISRGIPEFGREATPARLIRELMPEWGPARPDTRPPITHRERTLAAFTSPIPLLGFGSREVILRGDSPVGELTSRVRLPGWAATLVLALLDSRVGADGPLETVAGGRRWPLIPRATPWSMRAGTHLPVR